MSNSVCVFDVWFDACIYFVGVGVVSSLYELRMKLRNSVGEGGGEGRARAGGVKEKGEKRQRKAIKPNSSSVTARLCTLYHTLRRRELENPLTVCTSCGL